MSKFLIILQVLLLAITINAKEFAVANIEGKGISEGQAKMVTNALSSHLMRESKGELVPAGVVAGKQGTSVTNDASELVSLGKELEANTIVGGVIDAKGSDFTLTLSLYEVATSNKIGNIVIETADGFGGIMTKVLPEAAKKIAAKEVEGGAEVAAEPVEEKEPEAPKEVSFMVTSSPVGAKVLVNDEEKGITPYKLTIAPDMYKLTVSMEGYEFQDQVISVEAGMEDIDVALAAVVVEPVETVSEEPSVGGQMTNAVISTQPEGAEVELDGDYIGLSNLLYETTVGEHEISIILDGYRDTTFTVEFSGENNILEVPLFANEVATEFEDVSKGITTTTIVRISTGVVALGSLVGGIILNSQISSLNEDYEKEGMNFSTPLKDSTFITDLSKKYMMPLPIYQVALQYYYAAIAQGNFSKDAASVLKAIEINANVKRN